MSLASLLSRVMAAMQANSICKEVKCTESRAFSPDQFYFKIRSRLKTGEALQVRVYSNQGHIDYAYQVFTDEPVIRWDNKEDYPNVGTFPHHFHDQSGNVTESELRGEPYADIHTVLAAIAARPE